MTPIGHAAVSFLAARGLRLSLPALVIGGLAPDVDFVLLPFAGFNTWHRVLTHNIFFVLVLAAALALFSGKNRGRYFAAALIGGGLHLMIDSMLDTNPSNGIGVAFLWPLFPAPMSLVNIAWRACPIGWSDIRQFVSCSWPVMLVELRFWLIAAALLLRRAPCSESPVDQCADSH